MLREAPQSPHLLKHGLPTRHRLPLPPPIRIVLLLILHLRVAVWTSRQILRYAAIFEVCFHTIFVCCPHSTRKLPQHPLDWTGACCKATQRRICTSVLSYPENSLAGVLELVLFGFSKAVGAVGCHDGRARPTEEDGARGVAQRRGLVGACPVFGGELKHALGHVLPQQRFQRTLSGDAAPFSPVEVVHFLHGTDPKPRAAQLIEEGSLVREPHANLLESAYRRNHEQHKEQHNAVNGAQSALQ